MHTVLVYIFIVASISYNSEAQQYFPNQFQITGKPSQNEYVRLTDIPFPNAVRAVSTPQRDYVPIHESQQDIPPPPRPQQGQNQIQNQGQTYTNSIPVPYTYNNQFPMQQLSNIPMSFQYMNTNDYPNQVYNLLYHSTATSNGQTQGNSGYIHSTPLNNLQPQGNNGYLQGNNYLQTYRPSVIPGYTPMNNNFGSFLIQRNNKIPTNNHFQASVGFNGIKPSYSFGQNNVIDLRNIQLRGSTQRYKTDKSATLALPSNNNVQYVTEFQTMSKLNPRSPFFSPRTPRMTYTNNIEGYSQNSEDMTRNMEYKLFY